MKLVSEMVQTFKGVVKLVCEMVRVFEGVVKLVSEMIRVFEGVMELVCEMVRVFEGVVKLVCEMIQVWDSKMEMSRREVNIIRGWRRVWGFCHLARNKMWSPHLLIVCGLQDFLDFSALTAIDDNPCSGPGQVASISPVVSARR